MRGLNYIFSTIFLINSTLAQCPWQRDVPDLQTSCLCAYNLGNELSVQCDQVSDLFDSVIWTRPRVSCVTLQLV